MGLTGALSDAALAPIGASAAARVASPALVLDRDALEANIGATLALLDGDADRWRPHLKTAKLAFTMRRLVERGIRRAKCATTLELETACEAGFTDLILAYPLTGPAVEVTRDIAERFPGVTVSSLVEDPEMVPAWRGGRVGLFIDVNCGMDRTGIPLDAPVAIIELGRAISDAGLRFAGLHAYDGHAYHLPPDRAGTIIHETYDRLLELALRAGPRGGAVAEVVTAGTPAFPHAATYRGFLDAGIVHRLSPGTVVYNDAKSLTQLPADAGYRPAITVLSRVVSHPGLRRFTCDAGHKAVSADAGDPTCEAPGHPEWRALHPSEEHLPFEVLDDTPLPPRGTPLSLVPRHVCPTVNNFDQAVVVSGGRVMGVERVTARGRKPPLRSS